MSTVMDLNLWTSNERVVDVNCTFLDMFKTQIGYVMGLNGPIVKSFVKMLYTKAEVQ